MEHFGLRDSRPDSDSVSTSTDDSFVWPNFGSIDPNTTSASSVGEARAASYLPSPPPPLPLRNIRRSVGDEILRDTNSVDGHNQPIETRQHDGQGVLTPVTESPSHEQSWTTASKIVPPTKQEIQVLTLPRRVLVCICCFMCLMAVVFLIVAHSGSTRASKTSMNIYFFRMDLSYLFDNQTSSADGSSNPALAAAISQSIGLHDYYQAGLWGFCQGFHAAGLTSCSRPRAFYWFNPLGILIDELLLRSTIEIPSRAQTVLEVVRVLSQVMFGLYLVGAVLAVVLLLVSPFVLFSRWFSLPVAVLAGATAAPLLLASSIATFLAVAYRVVASSITQLHVVVTMGPVMFVMVWAAAGLAAATFLAHAILGCCATSVRDIETGYRPHVRLPPNSEAGNGAKPTNAGESGIEKKAGSVSLVSWNSALRRKKSKPTRPQVPPPRPPSAPLLSPLAIHPITLSRQQGLELVMPPSLSMLAGEDQE
ncbi:integral membrane protein [Ophiostoma piceae UAMH 11346]|uniref:Integral membrane protein n=1 Tax=Ophiostoma piceae (strain UAMH 11346) TaxID=1262450 RepID=S3CW25_OPHP1|nr:integral membrane protein [Ophiostoma piceae UAMH 11346]